MTVFFFFIFVFYLFLFCLPRTAFTFVLYYLAILAKHINISPSASDRMRVLSLCLHAAEQLAHPNMYTQQVLTILKVMAEYRLAL